MSTTLDLALQTLPRLDALLIGLAALPVWLGMPLMMGAGALFTLLGSLVVGVAHGPSPTAAANFLSTAKFGFLGEVFAALLAFVLVDGGIRYTVARQQVQVEAGALRLFDAVVADLSAYGVPALRRDLRTYAAAVVESEFISMQLGQESQAARAAFERVVGGYVRLKGRSEQDRLMRLQADAFLTKAQEARQKRLQAARPGLRTLTWTVFLANTVIVIIFSWFFRARSLASHMAMAVLMTVALMAIAHLAVLLYHPFTGDLAISPTPYLQLPAL